MCELSFYSTYSEKSALKFDCVIGNNVSHKFPLHIHDSLCIGLVTKGQRNIAWSDKSEVINQGEMFIVNRNQPHAINQLKPHDYIAITVKGVSKDRTFKNIINSDACVALFHQLLYAIKDNTPDFTLQKWEDLYEYLSQKHESSLTLMHDEDFMRKASEYMKNNYQHSISVDDIAKYVCMSTSHFCRSFKRLTGLSPHSYLRQYRLSQSYKCLQQNTPIFDTAIEPDSMTVAILSEPFTLIWLFLLKNIRNL